MNPVLVSDINEWSAFFSKLVQLHADKVYSALGPIKTVNFELQLLNTATTRLKDGSEFNYFEAVDKGRAAINKKFSKGFLVFSEADASALVFRQRVQGTKGAEITNKALARIHSEFDAELTTVFNEWIKTGDESTISGTPKINSLRLKTTTARKGTFRLQDTAESKPSLSILKRTSEESKSSADADAFLAAHGFETDAEGITQIHEVEASVGELTSKRLQRIEGAGAEAYDKVFRKLIVKARTEFDKQEIIRKASAAAKAASGAEAQRQGLIASERLAKSSFKPIEQAALENEGIQKLIKIPNWLVTSAIWSKTVGDQVENIWKPLTPVRSTGKLTYFSTGGSAVLLPGTGGLLRASYTLLSNEQLVTLLRRTGK